MMVNASVLKRTRGVASTETMAGSLRRGRSEDSPEHLQGRAAETKKQCSPRSVKTRKSTRTIDERSLYLDYSNTTIMLDHSDSPEPESPLVAKSAAPLMSSQRSVDETRSMTASEASEQNFQKPSKPLLMLAQQHKWRDIYDILRRRDNKYDLKIWLQECSNRHSGQTALHLVIKHKPPCSVVTLLIRQMRKNDKKKDPQSTPDKFGTTPLHIAVAVGCKVKVLEELLCGKHAPKDNPAAIADCSDRYPLHMACSKQVIGLQSKTLGAQVIGILAAAYPTAIYLKDNEGWTPKFMLEEYAYHKAISVALIPAEKMLLKLHGSNLKHLINGSLEPPMPLATTGLTVDPDDQASVSSIGWDEEKYGTIQEVSKYQSWRAMKREHAARLIQDESNSVMNSVTETQYSFSSRVQPRRRSSRPQESPHRFI